MKAPRTLSQRVTVFSTLVGSFFFESWIEKWAHNFVSTFESWEELQSCQVICQTINFSSEHDRGWYGEISWEKIFYSQLLCYDLIFFFSNRWSLVGSRCHGPSLPNAIPPCGGAPESSASKRWERREGSSCNTMEQELPLFSLGNVHILYTTVWPHETHNHFVQQRGVIEF